MTRGLLGIGVAAACLLAPAGAGAAATALTGMSWVSAIACTDASTCYVAGTDQNAAPAILTVTNGSPGAIATFTDPTFDPLGLACVSGGRCLAVGDDSDATSGLGVGAVATITGGRPGPVTPVSSSTGLSAVDCSGWSSCLAAGTDASGAPGTVVIASGQPQPLVDIPDAQFAPWAVACASATRCLVAGADGTPPATTSALSVVTGGKPGAPLHTGGAELSALACASATMCVAGGSANQGTDSSGTPIPVPSLTTFDGKQFSAAPTYGSYSYGGFLAAACPSSSTCVAVGGDDNGDAFVVPVAGGKPGALVALAADPALGPVSLSALACPSATRCLAIGEDGSGTPALVDVPVPTGASGGGGAGSGGAPGSSAPGTAGHGHLAATRVLLALHRARTRVTLTARCETVAGRRPVAGARVTLQERRAGARGAWRTAATALTRRSGARLATAVFQIRPARRAAVVYRAVLAPTGADAGAVSRPVSVARRTSL